MVENPALGRGQLEEALDQGFMTKRVERQMEIVEQELPRPGPRVGEPAFGEAAEPFRVVEAAQLGHERWVAALQQPVEKQPGAGFGHRRLGKQAGEDRVMVAGPGSLVKTIPSRQLSEP